MADHSISSPHADFFDIVYTCRSMRRLKSDPIPEEVLVKLADAAIRAPSSSNAQNWRFVIVREESQKRRIQELWAQGWAWYKDTVGSSPLRPGENEDARARNVRAGNYMVSHIHETPALIFIGVKKDENVAKALASPHTVVSAVKHLGAAGTARLLAGAGNASTTGVLATAYPAAQNLLLAARALGLGAVLTTPQLFHPGQYEKILGLPSDVTLACCIPVGYPKGRFGPVSRADVRPMISWDRYSA
jgi:nitroreductase